jgi:MarR family 2-MHQ and catechol resistance regulon transcriptional repressor
MSTHFSGTEEETRALGTFVKLTRAADSVAARVNAHLSGHGLTVSQFGVLEALHHLGPMCQKGLANKLLKSGANVTMVVDNLEKQGLVQRVRDSTDRRLVTVSLTVKGRKVIAALFPEHARIVAREMATLSPAQQDQLGTLCRTLGRRIAP